MAFQDTSMTEDETLFADIPEGAIEGSVLENKNETKAVALIKKGR